MNEVLEKLDQLWLEQMSAKGDQTKADNLYNKILESLSELTSANNTYDNNGKLIVYTTQAETSLLPEESKTLVDQHKNVNRLNYIKANKSYLEWYFTKKLGSNQHKFIITFETSYENTLLNKKTKTTLNIVLQRLV